MYSSVEPPEQLSSKSQNTTNIPCGVSQQNWTKFQELRNRREKLCKKSVEKRNQELRKKAVEPVLSQLQSEEEKSVLRDHGVRPSTSGKTSKWDEKATSNRTKKTQRCRNEEKWKDLKKYLSHASNSDTSDVKSLEKSITEKDIDEAIEAGNYKEAQSLNEQQATHDFVDKVASAIKSRDFADKRKFEEQEKSEKRKKKKLHWGFEQKHRWESKGNM